MAGAVAASVDGFVREALALRGNALLALPGGKSPARIFERLRQHNIDWSRVTLVPTDDRVVPIEHRFSNAAFLRRHFGDTSARLVPLVADASIHCRKAGDLADVALRALEWPPDLVWLGVGAGGHAASIFEGPDFEQAVDAWSARRAIGVRPDPLPADAPVARVTLTCRAIRSARRLLIALSGFPKRKLVEDALMDRAKPATAIAHVLARCRMPIEIHWSPE
jgi:6-phosphogluconolactonase